MRIESERDVVIDERELVAVEPALVEPTSVQPIPEVVGEAWVAPVQATSVRTVRTSRFSASMIIAGLAAIALLVLGGVTAARAGLDGSLDEPVVNVAGFTATGLLGAIELGLGAVFLIAALARQRQTILFVGILGGVGALIAVFQPSLGRGSLAIERGFAVWAAIVMGVIVVSALLPTVRRISTRRTTNVG